MCALQFGEELLIHPVIDGKRVRGDAVELLIVAADGDAHLLGDFQLVLHALGDFGADEPHHVAGLQQLGPKLDAEDALIRDVVIQELRVEQMGDDGDIAGDCGDVARIPGDLGVVFDVPTVGGTDENFLHGVYPFCHSGASRSVDGSCRRHPVWRAVAV